MGADIAGLAAELRKPLRPLWVSQASRIWLDAIPAPSELAFTPIYLISASLPNARMRRMTGAVLAGSPCLGMPPSINEVAQLGHSVQDVQRSSGSTSCDTCVQAGRRAMQRPPGATSMCQEPATMRRAGPGASPQNYCGSTSRRLHPSSRLGVHCLTEDSPLFLWNAVGKKNDHMSRLCMRADGEGFQQIAGTGRGRAKRRAHCDGAHRARRLGRRGAQRRSFGT